MAGGDWMGTYGQVTYIIWYRTMEKKDNSEGGSLLSLYLHSPPRERED